MVNEAYQIKGTREMQLHGSNYFAHRPPPHPRSPHTAPPIPSPHPDPRVDVSRSNFIFLEHGQVAYRIKGNHKMQQHGRKYFAPTPPHLP